MMNTFNSRIKYADPIPRLVAWLVDMAVVFFLVMVIMALSEAFLGIPFGSMEIIYFEIWLVLLLWGIGTAYGVVTGGQTFGKLLWNMRTIGENGEKASRTSLLLDNLLKFSPLVAIDFLGGVLKNAGDMKKRIRLMQGISKTVVIKE